MGMKTRLGSCSYEGLRVRAVELHQAGWSQRSITESLGVPKSTLHRWLHRYDPNNPDWYRSRRRGGKPSKLSLEDLERLVVELNKGCAAHGFEGEVWTRKRVGVLIERFFNVHFDPAHIGRLLKKAGWSLQRPTRQARQRSEEKVKKWYDQDIDRIKKSEQDGRLLFHADECAVSLVPFCAKTWAPKGQTPVLKEHKSREHLSIFAMISTQGDLCWQIQRRPFKAVDLAEYFDWLQKEGLPNHQFLIVWDGASIHRGQPVKDFLQRNPSSLHLEALPPYSPALNAAELLWGYLKCHKLKNLIFLNLDDLQTALEKAFHEIADEEELIQSFFKKESVAFL